MKFSFVEKTSNQRVRAEQMSLAQRKVQSCSSCGHTAATFICRGCSRMFCLMHTNEHRTTLEKQMSELVVQVENLQIGQKRSNDELLNEQINRWEEESMKKIRQNADQIRSELRKLALNQKTIVDEKYFYLRDEIHRAKENGEFFENDLKRWIEEIEQIRKVHDQQNQFDLIEEKNSLPLVHRFSFQQVFNGNRNSTNARFENYTLIEELNAYSTGEHDLEFQIEQYQPDSCLRFGIISAKVNEDPASTFYGWADDDLVFIAGMMHENYDSYLSDYQADDIVLLTIDCNRRMISLTNRRTHRIHYLDIDLNRCPFPWHPYIRFFLNQN